jgi:4-diphosphocytidyl-2-C-methyl-D-erythritol kinase
MNALAGRFPARTVRVKAPGKINVSLDVGPLRPDGYHSVASVYLAISLYEEVTATSTETPGITVSISPESTLDLDGVDIPLDGNNLAYKAAAIMADVSEHATGVHLEITKRVPVAGGMGGGSADAAATLLACDALWNSGLSRDELAHLAAELGADVPFALLGGTAVGLGVGDELSPALVKAQTDWVLVAADYGLPTPEVFRTLDRLRDAEGIAAEEPTAVDPKILQALRSGDAAALSQVLVNDLQRASIELAPALRKTLGLGEALGALAGIVSGSGPTVALLARNPTAAENLAEDLRHYGLGAQAVHGPVPGARIISDTLL